MQARWVTQVITVPASTGSVAYTGFGGTPKALFFFGTNWLTEDAAVTTSGTGMFRGMAAPQYNSPSTILQNAAAVAPAGDAHVTDTGLAIRMFDTSGNFANYLYYASVSSFDADGFTLNWGLVTAGGYKVVVVALMDVSGAGSREGLYDGTTIDLGFKAEASLLHGAWGANPGVGGSDRTQEFYGGAAYPGGNNSAWMSAGMSVFTFPTSSSQQYNLDLNTTIRPHIMIAQGGHFTGPFLVTSNIWAYPTGSPSAGNNFTIGGDSADGGMVVAWDECDSATGNVTIPDNEDDQSTVSGLSFAPGLLIGYSISDEPSGQGTGGRGAAGFSVVAPGFQWCALVDGVSSRGSFQSFQRGFCDRVSGTSAHAGTVELTDDGFVMTTVEDDLDVGSWIWHAFGYPTKFANWIPQIYRRTIEV